MKTPKKKTAAIASEAFVETQGESLVPNKIQIDMKDLRTEMCLAELCRRYSINESQFYKWNKDFLEAGNKRLADATRDATSDEVAGLKKENHCLKVLIADLVYATML